MRWDLRVVQGHAVVRGRERWEHGEGADSDRMARWAKRGAQRAKSMWAREGGV